MKRVVVTSMIEHICRPGLSSLPPLSRLHKQPTVSCCSECVCADECSCCLELVFHGALMLPGALSVCVCKIIPFFLSITLLLTHLFFNLASSEFSFFPLSSPLLFCYPALQSRCNCSDKAGVQSTVNVNAAPWQWLT